MERKTHILFSILIFLIIYHFFRVSPVLALFASFGATLPDFDFVLEKKLPKLLKNTTWKAIFKRGLHRTIFHNVWALGVFTYIFYILSKNLTMSLIFMVGYVSHLALDSTTKMGIHWTWPYGDPKVFRKKRFYTRGNFTTGSFSERILQVILLVIIILVLVKWKLRF